ncbi:MAG: class C sortase [Oscillospiraceae bacterium]|nr:class C sortase [Oscillospiraceae bacterium]
MRKAVLIIAVLLLVTGVTVFFYPRVQQFLYRQHARDVIESFEERMEFYRAESEDGTLRWLHDLMVAYNEHLYETGQADLVDALSYSQVDFSLLRFGFEEEMIGFITIPRMDIELPIYLGANDENMRRGAAHLTQTSLPVGGINTNTVIAAHRGFSGAAMFRDIEQLEIGDEIFITNFYETLRYAVVETRVILPNEVRTVLIQSGRDLVTLTTCHPYRHNSQRYLVFAERVA